ncbi:MAG: hypothetical protein LBE70_00555 [Nitrososphaerota archaeon]|jgi:hypothetical protein|nr:hypothetical protein [Nitrososphaerota archaeon]
MNLKKLLVPIVCVMIAMSLVGLSSTASATDAGYVWCTSDRSGSVPIMKANVNEVIYIHWDHLELGNPVDIMVVGPNNDDVKPFIEWSAATDAQRGALAFIPDTPGEWYIIVNDVQTYSVIAECTVFVVPESTIGSLMALSAGFAAFGAVAIVKKYK